MKKSLWPLSNLSISKEVYSKVFHNSAKKIIQIENSQNINLITKVFTILGQIMYAFDFRSHMQIPVENWNIGHLLPYNFQ